MLNSVNLVGRAGSNPDVKFFESGSMKATITLAVNRKQKNSEPDWFLLEFWGKTAQVVSQYVHKGNLIAVTGSLKIEKWVDKKNQTDHSRPVIDVRELKLLGSKEQSQFSTPSSAPARSYSEPDLDDFPI